MSRFSMVGYRELAMSNHKPFPLPRHNRINQVSGTPGVIMRT
ncbi:rCG61003, isoform CRA_a [Rattus norvegicus]|uniref:RCG61003, isoform CRA_a n=1 Tax=Rattus norvegicus TaxID=10116 RepID=A6JKX0_RAT|nr:rCG61003, isoform CRA_a [Rattus norvegicus]EDL97336.1 rCG61003, isoform CRA_a [Rattus norvegicus]